MIAQLRIPLEADDGYILTLNDDGEWVCSDWPSVAEAINDAYMHESDDTWKAHDAARRLGGEIIYLRA